jgi:GntR family transcriptional regulator
MPDFQIVDPSPVPLYVQVKDMLRERIFDGTYGPHAQLPPESEMGAIFGVSRITVRQALSDLQREGVIFKIPGKGTFVAKKKAAQELTRLEGFAEAMTRKGYEIHNRVVGHRTLPATAEVAQQLGVEVDGRGNPPSASPQPRTGIAGNHLFAGRTRPAPAQ